jgi:hypothetical protein
LGRQNGTQGGTMICGPCGGEIPPGYKYIAIFKAPSGLRIEVGCEHYTPADLEKALVTLGSDVCFLEFMTGWTKSLHRCDHRPS